MGNFLYNNRQLRALEEANLPPEGGYPATDQFPAMSTNTPPVVQTMNTGGNLPPLSQTAMTGGPLPPNMQTMTTGGNTPALPVAPQFTMPAINGQQFVATNAPGSNPGPQFGADQVVQNTLNSMLAQNSPYIQRARQAAMERAAERGMMNSSMAAGNAEGAAIDAVLPFVQQSLGIQQQRENNAFAANQNELNRTQTVNNALLGSELQQREVYRQDWLSNQQFTREFNGTLAMLPINNAVDLSKAISLYAAQDPEVYTPTVVSGMTNFFQQNMLAILQQYFPSMYGGGG